MANITGAQVTTALAALANWFGPHDSVSGVTDNVTADTADFTFETANDYTVTITYLELTNGQTARQRIMKVEAQMLGSAVSAGNYGPLELASTEAELPWEVTETPRIRFTTLNSNEIAVRFSELSNDDSLQRVIDQAEGLTDRYGDLKADVQTLDALVDAVTASAATQDDWEAAIAKVDEISNKYRGENR